MNRLAPDTAYRCWAATPSCAEVAACGYEANDIDERCAGCVLQPETEGAEDES